MAKSGISIIILTQNKAKHLERLLETFFDTNTHAPVEFIIIDHGSTDNTSAVVYSYATKAFIVSAPWLSAEAQKYGSHARYVSYGLDRDQFFTYSNTKRDYFMVAMMIHPVAWKKSKDRVEGLSKLRLRCPQVEIQLFGTLDTCFSSQFIDALSRLIAAAIIRKATIFVCSS
jgi:hypothetical protein